MLVCLKDRHDHIVQTLRKMIKHKFISDGDIAGAGVIGTKPKNDTIIVQEVVRRVF